MLVGGFSAYSQVVDWARTRLYKVGAYSSSTWRMWPA
jgi:hypothetical protein